MEKCIMPPDYQKEIWKDIQGYENIYQISTFGRVKSLRKNKIMSLNKRNGYYQICLRKNGKRKNRQVHRLVAEAFISNPLNKKIVNHKDYDPLNNNFKNLEWCTQKENVNWSICNMKHRKSITHTNTGEKYIYYRKTNNKYRVVVDKKEYKSCLTLKEAIKERDKILNEKI